MIPNSRVRVFFLLLGLSPLPAVLTAPMPDEPEEGAIVEEIMKGRAADRAGIRPGDLLFSWSRGEGNGGPVRSPFDLGQLEVEQALGVVTLHGTRESESREWILPLGQWGLRARPTLSGALVALYQQGRERIAAGDFKAGAAHWRSAVEDIERKDPLRAAWLQARLARELASAGRWPESDAALAEAVQRLERSHPIAATQLLREWDWNKNFWVSSVGDYTEARIRQALELEPAESLAAAWDLSFLGYSAAFRGDFAAADNLYRKAYTIRERLAPRSIDLASSLLDLADVAAQRGHLDTAEKDSLKALEIQEQLAPESLELSATLLSLGVLAYIQGDLSTAEERYQKGLALIERLSPDGPEAASTLSLLGIVAKDHGALAIAEERFRRALAIFDELAPESPEVARVLNYLGLLAEKRGDFTAAEEYHRRALGIWEKLESGSRDTYQSVFILYNLAVVEQRKENLAKADEYLQRALEILERSSTESWDVAGIYSDRGTIAIKRGNLALAEELHGRALAILEKQSPGSLLVSDILKGLGTIALKRGNLTKAEELFRRALALREKIAPGSTAVGLSLNDLGQVYRREGRNEIAAEHFCRATDVFDQQRKRLGGTTEGRSAFGEATAEHYHECLAALLDIGRPAEAFRALERGRARSFLDLLAERDLRWTADMPLELARNRKQTDTEYDRTQAGLDRLSPMRDQAEIDRLVVRLRELRARQEEIAAKVRQTSPRAAALQDPKPLDLASTRAALDPGTLLLAWSIGREQSFLFVVQSAGTDPGLEVFPLALGDQALRERVESFLNLLKRSGSDQAGVVGPARELYDVLLRPAQTRVSAAKRLLVSPDGPLHILPFAALVHDGHYLAEKKPVHTVISATVYAELKKVRREWVSTPVELVAFGDPSYPPLPPGQFSAVHPEVRAAVGRGLALTPLPSTREEVRDIAALYPEARTFLGMEATEERAKSIGKDARYIHFACHGLLDERFPLNSALALTIPEIPGEGQDNGLLQAWEIFENVRLDADLVTLSACDSALGQEMGGEGLLGLTRAFQYAGARSVVASLWSVSDVSTADLMKRFYGYLREGRSKDEALRAAQADLIQSEAFSHPYYWAAFQLTGDWR